MYYLTEHMYPKFTIEPTNILLFPLGIGKFQIYIYKTEMYVHPSVHLSVCPSRLAMTSLIASLMIISDVTIDQSCDYVIDDVTYAIYVT